MGRGWTGSLYGNASGSPLDLPEVALLIGPGSPGDWKRGNRFQDATHERFWEFDHNQMEGRVVRPGGRLGIAGF